MASFLLSHVQDFSLLLTLSTFENLVWWIWALTLVYYTLLPVYGFYMSFHPQMSVDIHFAQPLLLARDI